MKGLVARWSGRVGEALPTVRARLYALVAVTLLPALVILGYDEWLARSDLGAPLRELETSAAVAFASIDALRDGAGPTPPPAAASAGGARPASAAEARVALERLRDALDESDSSAASRALSELGGFALPAPAARDLARLRSHVEGYEYAEAGALASRLIAGLDGPA